MVSSSFRGIEGKRAGGFGYFVSGNAAPSVLEHRLRTELAEQETGKLVATTGVKQPGIGFYGLGEGTTASTGRRSWPW